ncbi:MAG: hypothetical protein WD057_18710 [Aquisalimonadaceae bacterium]
MTEGVFGGFDAIDVPVEEPQVIVHEADEPDPVGNFPNSHLLAGKHRAEADFASADAELAARVR